MSVVTRTVRHMSALIITHSHADGTLIEGTSRGDGTAEVLKTCGWRYSRQVGWYVPRSRDRDVDAARLSRTLEQLRGAGYAATTAIDATVRPTAEVERDREDRLTERAARLRQRADRQQQVAAGAEAAAHTLSDGWPLGQPLISEAARRHHRRMLQTDERERRESDQAAAAEARARAAQDALGSREAPERVANRIERLGATQRRLERSLAGYTSPLDGIIHPPLEGRRRAEVEQELAHTLEQLEHWRQVRQGQVSAGQITEYGPQTVEAGDHVLVNGSWYEVLRANPKTVTLRWWIGTAPTSGTVQWAKVRDHRIAGPRPTA